MLTTSNSVSAPRRRSTRNWDRTSVAAIPPCTLIPTYSRPVVSGTKIKLKAAYALQTLPLSSPIYATLRCTNDWFFFPLRAITPALRENLRMVPPQDIKFPRLTVSTLAYNAQILKNALSTSPASSQANTIFFYNSDPKKLEALITNNTCAAGSLASYFGVPVGHPGSMDFQHTDKTWSSSAPFDSLGYIAYLFVAYHFYLNAQCDNVPYLARPSYSSSTTDTPIIDYTSLAAFTARLQKLQNGDISDIGTSQLFASVLGRNAGFFLAPMLRTTFNRQISLSNFNATKNAGKISTEVGYLLVSDLIEAVSARNFAARYNYEAGSVLDWISNVYGVRPKEVGTMPSLIGRDTFYINFSAVVATSSEGLGDLGGRGTGGTSTKSRRISVTDPGVLLCVTSIVPDVVVPFASSRLAEIRSMADFPSVDTDNLPYRLQTLSEYYNSFTYLQFLKEATVPQSYNLLACGPFRDKNDGLTAPTFDNTAIGYVPFYNSFDMDYNRAYGDLVGSISHWVFTAPYIADVSHPDRAPKLSTLDRTFLEKLIPSYTAFYYDPRMVNNSFVRTDLGAQNFIFQSRVQINATVPYGYTHFPTL